MYICVLKHITDLCFSHIFFFLSTSVYKEELYYINVVVFSVLHSPLSGLEDPDTGCAPDDSSCSGLSDHVQSSPELTFGTTHKLNGRDW